MPTFHTSLDVLFEESDPRGMSPVEKARAIRIQLNAARQEVSNLESQLKIVTQRMNGDLALGIRRERPSLNVGISRDGCKVGYKTKKFIISPDIHKGVWKITSPHERFLRQFNNKYATHTLLNPNLEDFISSIVLHFTNHFKTLGEDLCGTGVIMVEGKRSNLVGLANWKYDNTPRLPSRAARRMTQ